MVDKEISEKLKKIKKQMGIPDVHVPKPLKEIPIEALKEEFPDRDLTDEFVLALSIRQYRLMNLGNVIERVNLPGLLKSAEDLNAAKLAAEKEKK